LAVVKLVGGEGKEVRVWTREVETGTKEREENMLAFAVEGLRLVADVVQGGDDIGGGEVVEERKGEVEDARI